jgi:hypothetical protein
MEGKTKELFDNLVEVLCGIEPSDPKLVAEVTGNWCDEDIDPQVGARLLVVALKNLDKQAAPKRKRRGRPKGSKNKAKADGSNGAGEDKEAAPRKRRGRPPTKRSASHSPPASEGEKETPPQDDTLTA